jgi:xanthine dehydrogenase accessory factor
MAEIISYFRSDKNLVTVDPNLIKTMTKGHGVDVRIVEKHGSAPRSVGSQMFVSSTGQLYGTIGGGAIENRSIEIAKQMLKEHQNYHLEQFTLDTSSDLGMICGGNAKVIFSLI